MIKLAWRNLWRNKRRTMITVASIFFAVFFAIIMRGFHMGTWLYLIDSVLHSSTGYVQIHATDYWDNRTFDYTLAANDSVLLDVQKTKNVAGLIPRIESFAFAASGEKTKGVITMGIDPEKENRFINLSNKIESGRYFITGDTGILLGSRLAKYFNVGVGDSVIFLSQGYHGISANGLFKVIGIIKLPSAEFDNQMVFMPLPLAQSFFSAEGRLTSFIVDLIDAKKMDKTIHQLKSILPASNYEVMSWKEMLVELYQQYISDDGGGLLMLGLLYLIVGFGIFGTVLMMIAERRREFGIMITLGMQRFTLSKLVAFELLLICILGLVAGFIGSIPIIVYFHFNPIEMSGDLVKVYEAYGMEPLMPVAWQTDYMYQQVINIAIIVSVVLIYPLYSVFKIDLTKAMRR